MITITDKEAHFFISGIHHQDQDSWPLSSLGNLPTRIVHYPCDERSAMSHSDSPFDKVDLHGRTSRKVGPGVLLLWPRIFVDIDDLR